MSRPTTYFESYNASIRLGRFLGNQFQDRGLERAGVTQSDRFENLVTRKGDCDESH